MLEVEWVRVIDEGVSAPLSRGSRRVSEVNGGCLRNIASTSSIVQRRRLESRIYSLESRVWSIHALKTTCYLSYNTLSALALPVPLS